MNGFETLGLNAKSLEAIKQKGFEEPTEIQALTIPLLLSGETDIIAQAQTGTGKTAAFALPLIEKLDPGVKKVQAIILAPTRELVIQVCEEINSLKGNSALSAIPIYGGQSMDTQLQKLKRGISIVVGTPGRILDHLKRKTLRLENISYFILDEADEMLNMGFLEDVETIMKHTPADKRVLLFSATMPERIRKLAEKYMGAYKLIKTKTKLTTSLTDQIYFEVEEKDKLEALCRIIDIETEFYGLIFCRTKNDVDKLSSHLIDRGYPAEGMHGDLSQPQREKILSKFRNGQIAILIATDVAARGIDVINLSHVINYAIPQDPESYIHRIGRTGRAGKEGTAITFITSSEFSKLGFIKRIADADIHRRELPDIKEIIKAKKLKLKEEIRIITASKLTEQYYDLANELLHETTPEILVASMLKRFCREMLDESKYRKIQPVNKDKRGRTLVEESGGKTRLFIAKGKSADMTKMKLVSFIEKSAGTPSELIEDIEIYKDFSFVSVPFREAEIILQKFKKMKTGRPVVVEATQKKERTNTRRR